MWIYCKIFLSLWDLYTLEVYPLSKIVLNILSHSTPSKFRVLKSIKQYRGDYPTISGRVQISLDPKALDPVSSAPDLRWVIGPSRRVNRLARKAVLRHVFNKTTMLKGSSVIVTKGQQRSLVFVFRVRTFVYWDELCGWIIR